MKRKPSEKFSWGKVPSNDVLDSIFSEMEALDRGEILSDTKKPPPALPEQKKKQLAQQPPSKRAKEKLDYAKYLPANWKEQKKAAEEKKNLEDKKGEFIEVDASELLKSAVITHCFFVPHLVSPPYICYRLQQAWRAQSGNSSPQQMLVRKRLTNYGGRSCLE